MAGAVRQKMLLENIFIIVSIALTDRLLRSIGIQIVRFLKRCHALEHMCQTQAREPNFARNVIKIGPRDHMMCALELAYGLYYIFMCL